MKHQGYLNRAMRSTDRRFARIFGRLGYDVSALSAEASIELIPIPEAWESMPWPQLRALAASLPGAENVKNKDDALSAIRSEIARRKGDA